MFAFLNRSRRELRDADRQVAAELAAIDRSLTAWPLSAREATAVDYLLDERLYHRPVDVMASAGEWGLAA